MPRNPTPAPRSNARARIIRLRVAALLLGLLVSAALIAFGYLVSPTVRYEVERTAIANDAVGIWQTDPVYGFSHIPGAVGRHSKPESFDVIYTIDASGNRVTPDVEAPRGRVLVLGGSFTFGHGVEDREAWPWLLGEALPDLHVVNRSAMAWSTGHALLSLEEALDAEPPSLVLYGWIHHHAERNFRRESWVRQLAAFGRHHAYFESTETGLEHVLVTDPDDVVPDDAPDLVAAERRITLEMLRYMRKRCQEAGIPFVIVRLARGPDGWLLPRPGFEVWDLTKLKFRRLEFDGHPNARWHAAVARNLAPRIEGALAEEEESRREPGAAPLSEEIEPR